MFRTRVWLSSVLLSEQKLHLATLFVPIDDTARAETIQQGCPTTFEKVVRIARVVTTST